MNIDGTVSALSGSCPNLSMRVGGALVETNGATKFKHDACSEIRNGKEVGVKGERSGNGPIVADQVEVK